MAKVIILGPAHPLRGGGMTTFNHRLAKEFIAMGHSCVIYSFSLQYPDFLFPGKSQYTDEPAPENINIYSVVNSINPLNWLKVGQRLKKERADIIVVRYWLPLMGPALGTILRQVKKNKYTKVICIADNVIPHEKRPGDKPFTRYFLKACDGFITLSEKVLRDLRTFTTSKQAVLVQHPLYDNFGPIVSKQSAREHLGIPPTGKIILFFGFIRKYKGLDILLQAVQQLKPAIPDFKLLVAGEFYEDEKGYQELIDRLDIRNQLILKTNFIADSEVKYYLCAADVLVQPYKNATQSGVTPLAYHFERPMIVTNVGGLPALVPHGKSGLVCEPDPASIAHAIKEFYELGEDHFIPHLRSEKVKYSWKNIVEAIFTLSEQ
ncbi:glycosyltransferase [Niabella yanshanensis]|uniref:Glycosyltransferase n=1 Tax=Niabella yanshanensis TaxID=577386 RepID=A0ABZ0WAM6_9BACT|nr:glycosyltransferase [Niabella yanshanensis]WQD39552.1 glycosyltransferase [Niabella yanshanensis]